MVTRLPSVSLEPSGPGYRGVVVRNEGWDGLWTWVNRQPVERRTGPRGLRWAWSATLFPVPFPAWRAIRCPTKSPCCLSPQGSVGGSVPTTVHSPGRSPSRVEDGLTGVFPEALAGCSLSCGPLIKIGSIDGMSIPCHVLLCQKLFCLVVNPPFCIGGMS